jgi:hypothetical protein
MHESDLHAEETGTRDVVDHVHTLSSEVGKATWQIVDRVGDVVHPGAALREEATDGRVLTECAQQLEAALADADGCRLDALLVHARAMLEPRAEETLVRVERAVEILDG